MNIKRNNHRLITSKKKKAFTNSYNNNINNRVKPVTFVNKSPLQTIVENTTFLSKPNHVKNMLSNQHTHFNTSFNYNGMNQRFKRSKPSKGSNRSNNFYLNTCKNMKVSSSTYHHQQQQQRQQQFLAAEAAATNLANLLYHELTINLTRDEPRMVIMNKTSHNGSQIYLTSKQSAQNICPNILNNNSNHLARLSDDSNGTCGASGAVSRAVPSFANKRVSPVKNRNYLSRFKYFKPAGHVRNHAPFNTTQYIMYDYSKRRHHDKDCTNEQKQFTDDWNYALANKQALDNEAAQSMALNRIENLSQSPLLTLL